MFKILHEFSWFIDGHMDFMIFLEFQNRDSISENSFFLKEKINSQKFP